MIILASVNDSLQVINSASTTLDIHATWVDTKTSDGTIAPGRTNSTTGGPATVTSVAAPAISFQRNVKTLHVRNKGSTATNVTVQHVSDTVTSQLFTGLLAAGKSLQMTDGLGFSVLT